MRFEQYLREEQYVNAAIEIAILMEADSECKLDESYSFDEILNEKTLRDKAKHILHKSGIHAAKSTGLIEYIFKGAKGLAKMFIAAFKGDKEEVKRLAKSIKKKDVLDFLLRLDQATMHLITGPLHMIDALTGWHIWADMADTIEGAADIVIKSISTAKSVVLKNIQNLKVKNKIVANLERIEKLVPTAGFA